MTAKRESGLRSRIVKRLRERGWLAQVQHGSVFSGSGRSDILGCAVGRFFAIEVKIPDLTSQPTPLQEAYLRSVLAAGGIAFVARSVEEAEAGVQKGIAMATSPPEDFTLDFSSLLDDLNRAVPTTENGEEDADSFTDDELQTLETIEPATAAVAGSPSPALAAEALDTLEPPRPARTRRTRAATPVPEAAPTSVVAESREEEDVLPRLLREQQELVRQVAALVEAVLVMTDRYAGTAKK